MNLDREGSVIEYTNAKTMMVRGPQELYDHMASQMERALGRSLPQMEVRFKNVSISADIAVSSKDNDPATGLPTLTNEVMKSIRGLTSSKLTGTKKVLQNVSGVLKPGTITLVLGQPGSGKSALMKLLSGRFPKKQNITIEGEVTYNGTPASDVGNILPQLVSYVQQRDKHYPELTVKETLEFAHAACGGDVSPTDVSHFVNGSTQENAEAVEAAQVLSKNYTYVVIQQLGLENCQNTVVGDAMLRGVSRGERKRVTTGEMAFGNKYVMMMDEISTGLDSAATFDIITTQRSIAKEFRKTVVISLLQLSPEVFALFDTVLIINGGRLIYHGPCKEVLNYFENIGFKCPPFRDVADFLLDLGTSNQFEYEMDTSKEIIVPRTPREFADAFESSPIYAEMRDQLSDPVDSNLLHDMEMHAKAKPEFAQSIWSSTALIMKRQMTITKREMTALVGRLITTTIMALLCSSVYYQFDTSDAQLTMGIIFESVLNLSLSQFSQVPTIMAAREVFYKQRGANFFRTISYVLSSAANQAPPIIVETFVFGSIVYWMCGFVNAVESFVIFQVVLCLINISFGAFFFLLASASPNINVANPISSAAIVVFVLFAGYTITKDQIPDYLIWIYWINPLGLGVRALAVNQYREARFDKCVYEDVDYCTMYGKTMGEFSLSSYEVPSEKFWIWYGMVYTAAAYLFFLLLSYIALEYHRYESPENVMLGTADNEEASEGYGIVQTPRISSSCNESILSVGPEGKSAFVPVTVAFRDLWYTVPDPANPKETINLLKGISGYALPGTITALMGSSGAGKTTLMDVIAGRKTGGKIQGQTLINGHPATDLAIRRSTGYCEQMDIHSESSTIREALTFSAFLRQGADVPDSYKYASVDECLDLLDLNPIADQIIRGSSVEQMKRLTIGVELAAQPSVLFLDEPTSGLDARSAKLIMDGVRKVANTGRTIICTIHQPSAEVFRVFDSLLLLKRGGETVFAGELGENASEMIDYFESINGVTKLKDNYNPATWMLEVIGAGVGTRNGDEVNFVGLFQGSALYERLQVNLDQDGVDQLSTTIPALQYDDKRVVLDLTSPVFDEAVFWNIYWRTASFNLTRFNISSGLGLLFGATYLGAEYSSYSGINSGMGMLYLTMAFTGLVAFNGMVPIASVERAVFYRERAAQTYNAFWYFFASSVMEVPYVFSAVLLFMSSFFSMVGFSSVSAFFICTLTIALNMLLQGYLAELLVFLLPNAEVAEVIGVLVSLVSFLFAGFSPPSSELPAATKWLYHSMPLKYCLAAISAGVFGDCSSGSGMGYKVVTNAPPSLPVGITVKEYLELNFLMKHNEVWKNCGIVISFVLLLRVMALVAMRFCNYQKR